ncbi:SpaA isopeptide-forming pilin-related protein [Streptomyces sp. NPDC003514]
MHARFLRGAVRSAAVAAAVTGTLTWAPTANAQPFEPTPLASTAAPAETPVPDAGSIKITAKDTAGDVLPGAAFLLLDSAGQEAGSGNTDAQGKLTFPDLAPGVYRLKETASGSPLHEVVADQDVIITPGATTRLTITDSFKAARVLLHAKDDKSGKLLPGATVNIGTGTSTLLTLTTGAKGTASGELPVSSQKTQFWVKQVKAPAGYDLYKPSKAFKAKPGDPVTVTVTNAKTATSPPPTEKPTDKPSSEKPGKDEAAPAPSASGTPTSDEATSSTAAPAPTGSLAHTGADAAPWLIGGAGLLITAGGGALFAVRRRRTDSSTDDGSTAS